ncbi:MAG: HAMP domain-containing sensor histidine kinase [Candidatus Eisenbacteria bacterium]
MAETNTGIDVERENPADLRKRILGLETLLELTRSLMVVQDRSRLESFLLLTVMGLLSVSRAILLTRDGGEDRFRMTARGLKADEIRDSVDLRPSGLFARRMRVVRDPVELGAEGLPDREVSAVELLRKHRMRHAVPIRVKEKLNGILLLGDRIQSAPLSAYEVEMLRSILDIAGIVMDNADLYEEMKQANRAMEEQNERLKEMDEMKTRFLSNVGHELRTPITCIVGFAECLRYPQVDEEKRLEFAVSILKQSERLKNLIDQVLDLSEFTHRKIRMVAEEGDLNELVQEVARSLRIDMEDKNLSLDLELSPELPPTRFDRDRTKRAIRNLIDNAIKFSHEDGKVRIESRTDRDGVEITVRDEGVGIPDGAIGAIFDPFRQADGSDTRRHGGAGIGLSLVKEIVEGQSGSVRVASAEGEGSVFTIRLPHGAKVEPTGGAGE